MADKIMDREGQLFFEDFQVGDRFAGATHEITDDDYQLFAKLIHYDPEYARATRFGKPVAHGLLVMAMTVLGATPLSDRLHASIIAFVEQGCRFLQPVFAGDTLRSSFEVAELVPKEGRDFGIVRFKVDLTNQQGEIVLSAIHAYMLRRGNPDSGSLSRA